MPWMSLKPCQTQRVIFLSQLNTLGHLLNYRIPKAKHHILELKISPSLKVSGLTLTED